MSLSVTQRPTKTVDSIISPWNAVGNPILYLMQRKDAAFTKINNNAGFVELQFTGVDVSSNYTANDIVYFESNNGTYSVAATVTSSTYNSSDTLVVLSTVYAGLAATGGYVNNDTARPLYRISVDVYDTDDTLLNESSFSYSPDPSGAAIIDISRILRAYLTPDFEGDLTGSTEVFDESNLYRGFYIKYTETWTGSAEVEADESYSGQEFYSVFAARQIPSTNGGNMWENQITFEETFLTYSGDFTGWANSGTGQSWTIGTSMDVSLTAGQTSKYAALTVSNVGARTNLQFQMLVDITTTLLPELNIYVNGALKHTETNIPVGAANVVAVDISTADAITSIYVEADNGSGAGTSAVSITDFYLIGSDKRLLTKFNNITMWRGWPCLIGALIGSSYNTLYGEVDTDQTSQASRDYKVISFDINQMLTDQTLSSTGFVIREGSSGFAYSLSEEKTIVLRDACTNPIMLLGRNLLGGPLQWLFEYTQEYTFDYGNGMKAKRLVLVARNLTINDWEALQDFITLGEVYRNSITELTSSVIKTHSIVGQQVYAIDEDGNKTGVLVIPTRNTTRTNYFKHTFEIEIEYPAIYAP